MNKHSPPRPNLKEIRATVAMLRTSAELARWEMVEIADLIDSLLSERDGARGALLDLTGESGKLTAAILKDLEHSNNERDQALRELDEARERKMTEEQIKHMVSRFLGWRLPKDFSPDDGISFDPISNPGSSFERRREPTGTNLLDADQAAAMVRHMIEGMPDAA